MNTAKPFTVVTQFLTNQAGVLDEIRRLYVQNGNVIGNSVVAAPAGDVTASGTVDSITPGYCNATAATFEDAGGFPQMSKALAEGMVLIFSIWNDQGGNMTWLDSGSAGPCDPVSTQGLTGKGTLSHASITVEVRSGLYRGHRCHHLSHFQQHQMGRHQLDIHFPEHQRLGQLALWWLALGRWLVSQEMA